VLLSSRTFTVPSAKGTFVSTSNRQLGEQPAAWTLVMSKGARIDDRASVKTIRGTFALKTFGPVCLSSWILGLEYLEPVPRLSQYQRA